MDFVLYRAVEANLRAAMRCYARVSSRGEARDYPGLSVASCGLNCAVFNSAMLNRPVAERELRRALSLAGVHFGQRRLGWTFWLCHDLVPAPLQKNASVLFRNSGLDMIAQPPGMYAEQLQPVGRHARELQLREVTDETARLDFAHLSSVIFNLPFETSRLIYGSPTLWDATMNGWVGYVSGRAVCIVTVVIGGGVLGVYSVGTLPEYQRRGFAETAVRYALARAGERTGLQATVLQSTAQGMNLYVRMGYRVVTRFGVYLNEGNGSH
jgi:ribosomal protein S18 acetylase RimI-like enzyme